MGGRLEWHERGGSWEIRRPAVTVVLDRRGSTNDHHGQWIALIFPRAVDVFDITWPRYYFDLERAKLEIEAWLIAQRF